MLKNKYINRLEKGAFKFALWSFQKFLSCAEEKLILSYVEGIKSKRESLADIEEVLCGLVMMISKASEWKKLVILFCLDIIIILCIESSHPIPYSFPKQGWIFSTLPCRRCDCTDNIFINFLERIY